MLSFLKKKKKKKKKKKQRSSHSPPLPPTPGSPKSLRTVLLGDAMGLEMFVTREEAMYMARVSASLPWLFPILEEAYPDVILRFQASSWGGGGGKGEGGGLSGSSESFEEDGKGDWEGGGGKGGVKDNKKLLFYPLAFTECLNRFVPKSQLFFEKFYLSDPSYLKIEEEEEGEEGEGNEEKREKGKKEGEKGEREEKEREREPAVLQAPPLKRIWVVNGINRFTEVGYYFRMDLKNKLAMDPFADRYSGKKLAGFVFILRFCLSIFVRVYHSIDTFIFPSLTPLPSSPQSQPSWACYPRRNCL